MQLSLPTLEKELLIKEPLKYQLLKWIGNKQRYAKEIVSYFPIDFNKYYEPFIGSGAIMASLAPDNGLGSDNFPPLIEIWKTLKHDPEILQQWYEMRWERMNNGNKLQIYEEIKASYNKNPNGGDLLFLSRSCYGGVVRFRKSDGYMSTPCGIHSPIHPFSFNKRVKEWYARIKNVDFELLDYKDAMNLAKRKDLVYCDPPYAHSQGILYGAQGFSIEELFCEIEKCKLRGVYVALSIDGTKKSGTHICNLPIPSGLFKREILIDCGKSMLKRFQMGGETLETEEVKDRLMLTF